MTDMMTSMPDQQNNVKNAEKLDEISTKHVTLWKLELEDGSTKYFAHFDFGEDFSRDTALAVMTDFAAFGTRAQAQGIKDVYLVIDTRNKNLLVNVPFTQLNKIQPLFEQQIIAANSPMIASLATIFKKLAKSNIVIVPTINEAYNWASKELNIGNLDQIVNAA